MSQPTSTTSTPIDIIKAAKEAAERINNLLTKKAQLAEITEKKEILPTELKRDIPKNITQKDISRIEIPKLRPSEEDNIPLSQYGHVKDPLFDNSEAYFKARA